jgi:hypothetical protein
MSRENPSLFGDDGQPAADLVRDAKPVPAAATPSPRPGAPADCPHCGRPMGDIEEGGQVGRAHPDTSRDAMRPSYGGDHFRVMSVLAAYREAPADTVAAVLVASPNQVATRLLELRRGGWVQYVKVPLDDPRPQDLSGRAKGRTRTGRYALLQRLTPAGSNLLADLRAERSKATAAWATGYTP